MAKVLQLNLPPEYQPLLDKILSWYDSQIYPTWATRYFHTTRKAKKRNKEKTILPKLSTYWSLLTTEEKENWGKAIGFTGYNKYQLFIADCSIRKKLGLSYPGEPSITHQLHGLKMDNSNGINNFYIHFHLKDLTGALKIEFFFKKQEISPTPSKSFKFKALAFYFEGGLNIVDSTEWECGSGNYDWTSFSQTFGTNGRRYFHLIIEFNLSQYPAIVYLDNFAVYDKNGLFYSDSFVVKSGQNWNYQKFYRKEGWAFYPAFEKPYYDIIYLDS